MCKKRKIHQERELKNMIQLLLIMRDKNWLYYNFCLQLAVGLIQLELSNYLLK